MPTTPSSQRGPKLTRGQLKRMANKLLAAAAQTPEEKRDSRRVAANMKIRRKRLKFRAAVKAARGTYVQ